jgi:hypothetical protein
MKIKMLVFPSCPLAHTLKGLHKEGEIKELTS